MFVETLISPVGAYKSGEVRRWWRRERKEIWKESQGEGGRKLRVEEERRSSEGKG